MALTPDAVDALKKKGFTILVEAGAGRASSFEDSAYQAVGAEIRPTAEAVYGEADLVLRVRPPQARPELGKHEVELAREGAAWLGFLFPLGNAALVGKLTERRLTAFAMDLVPRITKAQSMDALSSQSTVAGYRAALLAASHCPKFFPMLTTAAGTVPPARVVVLGAGVAGLQAISTAKRLGALVKAYDVRAATKEQVESLGGQFIVLAGPKDGEGEGGYAKALSEERQAEERRQLAQHLVDADVVITTALVPGKAAPRLLTAEMLQSLPVGAVVVDMAAEAGGNVEGSQAGETVDTGRVRILAPLNLPATLPVHASRMYARNLVNLLGHLAPKGEWAYDMAEPIAQGCCVTKAGELVHAATKASLEAPKA